MNGIDAYAIVPAKPQINSFSVNTSRYSHQIRSMHPPLPRDLRAVRQIAQVAQHTRILNSRLLTALIRLVAGVRTHEAENTLEEGPR